MSLRIRNHSEYRLEAVIGANVKRLRLAQNLTQADIAFDADMSIPQVCYIENAQACERRISLAAIARIAEALGVPPAVLLMTKAEARSPKRFSADARAAS